ncbi:MAG TPA: trehalose-6-phosphate synthase [Chloroflexi bacterium]|nr:trehalose-6-phosphate synthase [Chloroflexota bacterium]
MTVQAADRDDDLDCPEKNNAQIIDRSLIIVSNRAPMSLSRDESGQITFQRGSGGLVTALMGLVQNIDASWIAAAESDVEREWHYGRVSLLDEEHTIQLRFIRPGEEEYDRYYNQISNPLIWFLQHSMWDVVTSPTITAETWAAWEQGYVPVNRQFAEAVAEQIKQSRQRTLVMFQDYHLYLAPRVLRQILGPQRMQNHILTHFVHIPWPGSEDWGILPPGMRQAILEGLCANDVVGFQTREDALNFIRSVESHLPRSHVNFSRGRIWYRNHATYVRDFPISIDVDALKQLALSERVASHRQQLEDFVQGRQLIVRIDRTEPSKNIARGFQAYESMLEMYPEHCGSVQFVAILVPSRLKVEEYQSYLDDLMAAAGRVNARFGTSDWEPVRVLLGEDYDRAIAALQLYDVLLVNAIADGMNLVAKEGPVVNQRDGVLILSERAGARQQMEPGATIISPCDVFGTANALHQALIMPAEIRRERALRLRKIVEEADVNDWFCEQLSTISQLFG